MEDIVSVRRIDLMSLVENLLDRVVDQQIEVTLRIEDMYGRIGRSPGLTMGELGLRERESCARATAYRDVESRFRELLSALAGDGDVAETLERFVG